jgi:hypothetical protein
MCVRRPSAFALRGRVAMVGTTFRGPMAGAAGGARTENYRRAWALAHEEDFPGAAVAASGDDTPPPLCARGPRYALITGAPDTTR